MEMGDGTCTKDGWVRKLKISLFFYNIYYEFLDYAKLILRDLLEGFFS